MGLYFVHRYVVDDDDDEEEDEDEDEEERRERRGTRKMRQKMGIMAGCRSVVGSTSTTFCRMAMDHDLELHRCRALTRHLEGQSWVTATERMEAMRYCMYEYSHSSCWT